MEERSSVVSSLPKKKPYVLSFALFTVMIVIGAFFLENIAFFNPVYSSWMTDFEFYLTLGVAAGTTIFYLVFAIKNFSIKLNLPLLVIGLLLFIGNLVALLCFPDVYKTLGNNGGGETYEVIYFLSSSNRVRFALCFFFAVVYIYILLAVFPKTLKNTRLSSFAFIAVILVCLFSIGFSLVTEWNKYVTLFSSETSGHMEISITSFVNNPNVYSSLLLVGVYSSMFMHERNKRWFYFPTIFLFSVFVVLTMSQTGIYLVTALDFAYLLYLFFKTFKSHPGANITLLVIILVFITFILLGIFGQVFAAVPGIGNLFAYIRREIDISSKIIINLRLQSWKSMLGMLDNPERLIFGLGEYNFGFLFGQFEHNNEPCFGWIHNGFLHQLACGGILRMTIYVVLIGYLFYLIVKRFAAKERTAFVSLIFLFITLVQSFTETTAFIMSDSKCMIMLLFIAVPLLVEEKPLPEKEVTFKDKTFIGFALPLLITAAGLCAVDVLLPILMPTEITTYAIVALAVGNACLILGEVFICGYLNVKGLRARIMRVESWIGIKQDKHAAKVEKRMALLLMPKQRRKMAKKAGFAK